MNVIARVGISNDMLETLLVNDNDGFILPTIITQCQLNGTKVTMEIMRRWIRGGGRQPVTWQTLTETLKIIGLTELASSIESSLRVHLPQFPHFTAFIRFVSLFTLALYTHCLHTLSLSPFKTTPAKKPAPESESESDSEEEDTPPQRKPAATKKAVPPVQTPREPDSESESERV